jgi:hypothetical protein
MSDGTSLEDLERGDVSNQADAARMQDILKDIDAPSAASGPMGGMPSMQQSPGPMRMQQMPPMYDPRAFQQQQQQRQYVPVDEEEEVKPRARKSNIWSSILERLRDPLVVGLLVLILVFPALHTQLAKYASWAYAVGGQLNYIGLGAISLLAALVFGIYKVVSDLLL